MTTPTSKPVPSNAPQDLLNNSEVFDGLINKPSGTVTNRKGAQLVTYNEAISRLGFYAPVAFASGLAVTNSSFTVIDGGNYYFANPTAIPFTTTGTFNPAQWRLFNQEFAGAEVGKIDDFATLRLYGGTASPLYVAGRFDSNDGAAGFYALDLTDTTTTDDDFFVLVDALGRRWKRQNRVALKNSLWAGAFQCWPMGRSLAVSTVQRLHVPAGVTSARIGFVGGVTIAQSTGAYLNDALVIQRTSGNAITNATNVVLNLSFEETKPLAGQRCILNFYGKRGAGNSGVLSYRVQYSNEPEQPIVLDSGEYTNGNQVLKAGSVNLGLNTNNLLEPYSFIVDVPNAAKQVSVVLSVQHTGTAGDDDFVELEGVSLCVGGSVGNVIWDDFNEASLKAATRYQSSYPYSAPRGTNTGQGILQAIATNANGNWAFAMRVDFKPRMAVTPKFFFQSPTSGTESRLLNKNTGSNVNGLAFDISDNGVTITNNAILAVGDRCACHWTAQAVL